MLQALFARGRHAHCDAFFLPFAIARAEPNVAEEPGPPPADDDEMDLSDTM